MSIDCRLRMHKDYRDLSRDEIFDSLLPDCIERNGELAGRGVAYKDLPAMSLEDNGILGIALGSSEAGGYVTLDGNITGWLNELAFAPIDYSPTASTDEWSGDQGGSTRTCRRPKRSREPTLGRRRTIGQAVDSHSTRRHVEKLWPAAADNANRRWTREGIPRSRF